MFRKNNGNNGYSDDMSYEYELVKRFSSLDDK